jgi:hypothetical protein
VERLATVAVEYHLDRRLRSAHMTPAPAASAGRSTGAPD